MSEEDERRLRAWHEAAYRELRDGLPAASRGADVLGVDVLGVDANPDAVAAATATTARPPGSSRGPATTSPRAGGS